MKTKHTEGPWEISFGELNGSGEFSIYQGETGTICRGDDEMIRWKANAHLIAAAPELLDALTELTNRVKQWADNGIPAEIDHSYVKSLSAIAKTVAK